MHKSVSILVSLAVTCLVLAACGGNEPTPTPVPPTPTAVATVAPAPTVAETPTTEAPTAEAPAAGTEVTSTEAVTSTTETTSTEAATPTEAVTSTTETSSTESATPTEAVTTTTETTTTTEAATETVTSTTETTSTAEATATEAVTATTEATPTEEATATETVTATTETTSTEEATPTETPAASSAVTSTEEVTSTSESTTTSGSESAPAAAAPNNAPINVLSERQVTDVLNEKYPYYATLSPDGTQIVYATQHRRDRSLCVYTFTSASVNCTTPPEKFHDYPNALIWSPDSKLIAFTENPMQLGDESDIWIYDVAAGTYSDITDDNIEGFYRDQTGVELDYLPMWNKVDGKLYFWRSVPDNSTLTATRVLMKIDPKGGQAEVVRDLSKETGQALIPWDSEDWYLDGVSDLNPAGNMVAVLVTLPQDPYESPLNGLWVVDLTSPDSTPKQLMTIQQFQSAAAPFQNLPTVPVGLSWTGDGKGVVAAGFSNDTHSPLLTFYYIDVDSGKITPIVDFSQVPDLETFYSQPDEVGLPMRYYSPWTAVLSPNRDNLLMYNDLGGVPGMLQAPLPPNGSKPVVIFKGENSSTGSGVRASSSVDGKVLIYGNLLTVGQ